MRTYNRQIRNVSRFGREVGMPANRAGTLSGAAHIFTLGVLLIIFMAGGGYLYSVNRSAVQGYSMRALEKEIDKLKQENAELKITEADLRSLYRIEASEEALAMQKPDTVIYLEERESVRPVALK
jgi:Tfp pilus assembly protein PilN